MNPIHPALTRLARAAANQDFAEVEETLHVALRMPAGCGPSTASATRRATPRATSCMSIPRSLLGHRDHLASGQMSAMHGTRCGASYGIARAS